jgi:hypothetical protein
MPQFFIILLKINLVLVLFAAAYYLILRRLTFYTINRLFLVFGIVFSTVYPFINLTDFFHRQQQINQEVVAFVPKLNQQVNALVPSNFIAINWQLLSILFYVGVTLMAIRLIIQFVSLYRMHKKSLPGAVDNYPVRILKEPVSPFSFWQTVYINPSLHQENELNTILAHEKIHVKEWHSLDIILAELCVVFYWFNPGVWLMKKAVKENLEFITDQKILNKGVDRKTYQYSLLDVGNLTPAVAIVNNFNLSDLKKRIKMMNLKRSSRLTLSRYLLVTPILLVTTLAFTVSKKDIKKHLMPLRQVFVSNSIFDAPKATTKLKRTNIRQKSTPVAIIKVPDTTNKVTLFVKGLFIGGDSLSTQAIELFKELHRKDISAVGAITGQREMGSTEKMYIYTTDSLTKDEKLLRFENIKRQLKGQTVANTDPSLSKVVVVQGFPKGTKLPDSVLTKNVRYFLNGKQLSPDDLSKINPENIQNIMVERGLIKATGIRISSKEN